MKIEKSELKRVLNKLGVCIDKSNKEAKISFKTMEDKIIYRATDGINGICLSMKKEGQEKDWHFLVEYKFLLNCCKLRGKTLEINKEENKLVVSDDNTVFENAVNDTDVELFEDKKFEKVGIKLNVDQLQKVLKNGAFARNEKDTRKFITGAELNISDGKLQILSTDSKRMAKSVIDIQNKDFVFKGVLSPKIIEAIDNFDKEDVQIRFCDNVICFDLEDYKYYMPLLDGSFPDTSKFFTEEDYCQYKVKRNDILESFNLLSIIEGTETNIQCKEGKIELICNNAKNNVKDVIVGEKIVGDDFGFNVNRELFSDIFKNMSEEQIYIKYKGEGQPVEYSDKKGSCGVIMPLRKS